MRDFVDVTVVENGQPWVGGGKPVKGVVNGDRISIPTRDIRALRMWDHAATKVLLSRGRALIVEGLVEDVKRACAEETETEADDLFEALAQVCTRVEALERADAGDAHSPVAHPQGDTRGGDRGSHGAAPPVHRQGGGDAPEGSDADA